MGRVGQVLGPVGELAVRAAVVLLLCASSALAGPDRYSARLEVTEQLLAAARAAAR